MHKLKEMFMKELHEYEDKAKRMSGGRLSQADIDKIHKLTDTVKNIDKIEMLEDGEGYSEDGTYMGEGRIYGTSYARGRGRNARRDSMGRYSRDDGMSYERGSSYDDDMSYARDGRGGNRGMRGRYSGDDAKEMIVEKAEKLLRSGELEPHQEKAVHNLINALDD